MPLPEYFEFQSRTKVIFGEGTLNEVGKEAARLGATKAFIVTDEVIEKQGFVEKVKKSLEDAGIETAAVFNEVPQDSDIKICKKGENLARKLKTDIVIAIGGGSVLDTSKGINILLTEGGDLLEDHQGTYLLQRPLKPLIAIPTTAGTGSEVTFAAVIKDREQKLKISFISPYIAPDVGILDPELTLTLPPKLTASTGMDALTHGIEAIHTLQNEPISDALALYGIKLISQNLREATHNGKNLEARGNMLIAASIVGVAFSNALVGIVHAMAHACGGLCGVPHGIANSILLPYGMEYNVDYCPERYKLVAEAMGVDVKGLSDKEAAIKAVEEVKKLTKDLGIPLKLREVGVKEEEIPKLAEDTLLDGSIYNNPREATAEEVEEILRKAY